MTHSTRRSFLKGTAAAAAGAAVSLPAIAAAGPDHLDAKLFNAIEAWCLKHVAEKAVSDKVGALCDQDRQREAIAVERAELDPAATQTYDAYLAALAIPATTPEGLLAKLDMVDAEFTSIGLQWNEEESQQITADVRRVLGRAGS